MHTEKRTLEDVVEQIQDYAIIRLDVDGLIQSWNLGAQRVKGYLAEEVLGRSFEIFYPADARAAGLPQRLLAEARRTGHAKQTGWRARKGGGLFWADVVITAIHHDDGELAGYVKVTRDRTDVKELEEAQDAFYAAFEHDFRTPLTALKGFAEALRESDDEDERDAFLHRITTSADRLLGMVESLTRVARRRVAPELPMGSVELQALSAEVIAQLDPELHPARVRVTGGAVHAAGNGEAMQRVLTNVLVNALKYSRPGTPVGLDIGFTRDGHARLVVADQGRGILPEDVEHIFDAFERGRLAQNDGGTGLGLTSARDLMHQQDGVLWLESEVGVGTTVTIELQLPGQRFGGPEPAGHPEG